MIRKLMSGALALFAVTAAADPEAELRCREIAFSRAAEARDAQAFASFLDAQARFAGSGVLRGPQAVVDAWSAFFDPQGPAIRWRPQIVEVLEADGLGLTRGPYRVTSLDEEGNSVEHWGTFNTVWRRGKDGHWRVLFDAGSPAAGPPSEEEQALLAGDPECPAAA